MTIKHHKLLLFIIGIAVAFAHLTTSQNQLAAQSPPSITAGIAVTKEGTKATERSINFIAKANLPSTQSRLYPSAADMVPGTAAPIILRMNAEAAHRLKALAELDALQSHTKPLEELNLELTKNTGIVNRNEMRRAVFQQTAGWQYPLKTEPQFGILLPDVQESRRYARAMSTFARGELLMGNIPATEEWILLTMGLARHVGETPFAVCRLVQAAEIGEALNAYEELIQHPQASNYYWDLKQIPQATSLLLDSAQVEASAWENSVFELKNIEELKSEEQWTALAKAISAYLPLSSLESSDPEKSNLLAPAWVSHSRVNLAKTKPEFENKIKTMGDAEASVRYWWERVKYYNSRIQCATLLKLPAAIPELEKLHRELNDLKSQEAVVALAINEFLPLQLLSLTLLQQRIELLVTIESIRDWSARHDGKLPNSLSELQLPISRNPFNDEPFKWTLTENGKEGTLSSVVVLPNSNNYFDAAEIGRTYRLKLK